MEFSFFSFYEQVSDVPKQRNRPYKMRRHKSGRDCTQNLPRIPNPHGIIWAAKRKKKISFSLTKVIDLFRH
jgi:hypothetical protein